jgi:hypothetical protein
MESDGALSSVTRQNNSVGKFQCQGRPYQRGQSGPVSCFAGSETMSGDIGRFGSSPAASCPVHAVPHPRSHLELSH